MRSTPTHPFSFVKYCLCSLNSLIHVLFSSLRNRHNAFYLIFIKTIVLICYNIICRGVHTLQAMLFNGSLHLILL